MSFTALLITNNTHTDQSMSFFFFFIDKQNAQWNMVFYLLLLHIA